MSPLWLLPAGSILIALVATAVVGVRLARETARLSGAVRRSAHLGVATDDLDRSTQMLKRSVAEVGRR